MTASHPEQLDFEPPSRIAVIGAGLAGLAAARDLKDAGFRVKLFDKGRGVGGRTSSRRTHDFTFDHGAQYFTARDARFSKLVASARELGIVEPWRGEVVQLGAAGPEALTGDTERFVGVPTMSSLARHLASDLDVDCGVQVDSVQRNGSDLFLFSEGISLGQYAGLICTLPAGQVPALLGEVTTLAALVSSVSMQPCWSVMLGFDRALDVPFDGAFVDASPLSWVARNSSKPGRPDREAWVLHAGPDWTTDYWNATPELVIESLTQAFADRAGTQLPAPVHAVAHRWRYSLPDPPLNEGSLYDPRSRIALAGDWCHGARIEGAVGSGWSAAARLIADESLAALRR